MKVVAVVVTFHPVPGELEGLVRALAGQVTAVVLVDNGSPEFTAPRSPPGFVHVVRNADNLGVAAAQNIGIQEARRRGAAFVLLFDQDSVPAPDMVARLLAAAQGAAAGKVAAVGPRYRDGRRDTPPPFITVEGLRLRRHGCPAGDTVVAVDYLVSSGSLIPMATLDAVGAMREGLFIDYIDIEWGLRARARGYRCLGVCGALMDHTLGEPPIPWLGRSYPSHSPLRHYYLFRNAVLLYRERWIPLNWKVVDGSRLALKYVFYSLFARPRRHHLAMMTKGILHGLRGVQGKLG